MKILTSDAAEMLQSADDILILTHQSPDGDTLGSGFAICRALRRLGKRAQVVCSDQIPHKYAYLWEGLDSQQFTPKFILAVDVADPKLLGNKLSVYADKVDLCIDHHGSNTQYAKHLLLEECAATCEMIYGVIGAMGVELDRAMAEDLYTGISTDTGCFRYSNTTVRTHLIAAKLLGLGIDAYAINRAMFEIKSPSFFALRKLALDSMETYFDGHCALIYITYQNMQSTSAQQEDLDGLTAIPRQMEGVDIGVILKEKEPGAWKISVRTGEPYNASALCSKLGGGGHARAAGCALTGTAQPVRDQMLPVLAEALGVSL